jgi:hypothetical protein
MEVGWAKEQGKPIKFVNWQHTEDVMTKPGFHLIEVLEDPELVEKLLASPVIPESGDEEDDDESPILEEENEDGQD